MIDSITYRLLLLEPILTYIYSKPSLVLPNDTISPIIFEISFDNVLNENSNFSPSTTFPLSLLGMCFFIYIHIPLSIISNLNYFCFFTICIFYL